MKFILSLSLLIALSLSAQAVVKRDTLLIVTGKVIDADNKQPVTAKITYESLPYANISGVFASEPAYGKFEMYMLRGAKYTIKIEAEGYQTINEELDLQASPSADTLTNTYSLVPTGAGRILRLEKLIFELGRFNITPESFEELDRLVGMLNDNPKMVIQLEGHTDVAGNADSNMRLSERRVEAVKQYLLDKGINKNRIKTKAFGSTLPLSRENTEEAKALNRRVEVRIIKN